MLEQEQTAAAASQKKIPDFRAGDVLELTLVRHLCLTCAHLIEAQQGAQQQSCLLNGLMGSWGTDYHLCRVFLRTEGEL